MTSWYFSYSFYFFSLGCSFQGWSYLAGICLGIFIGLVYANWWIEKKKARAIKGKG